MKPLSERIKELDSEYGVHLHAGFATEIGNEVAAIEAERDALLRKVEKLELVIECNQALMNDVY